MCDVRGPSLSSEPVPANTREPMAHRSTSYARSVRWLRAGLAGAVLSAPSFEVANAADGTQPLVWVSPTGCPSVDAVMHSLGELIDIRAARWDRFRSIEGRVVGHVDHWSLELVFAEPAVTRTRRIRVEDCAATADLAAVTLALALDPEGNGLDAGGADATAEPPTSGGVSEPVGAGGVAPPLGTDEPRVDSRPIASTEDEAARAPSDASTPDPSVPTRADLGLAAIMDPSGLGAPNFGISLGAAVQRSRYSLGLHADWLPSASVGITGGREVRFALVSAGVRGCYGVSAALGLCTELEAGALAASGADLDNGRSVRDPWVAPGASLALSGALAGSLSLVSRFAVLVPLVRGEYFVNDGEPVHRTPPVVMRLALGITLPIL
jgi:hypothetical protein